MGDQSKIEMNFERDIDPKKAMKVGLASKAIPIKHMIDVSFNFPNNNRVAKKIWGKDLQKILIDLTNCKSPLREIKEGYFAIVHKRKGEVKHTVPSFFAGKVIQYKKEFYVIPPLDDPRWRPHKEFYGVDHINALSILKNEFDAKDFHC